MPVEAVAKDTKTRQLLVPNCGDDEVDAKTYSRITRPFCTESLCRYNDLTGVKKV